MFVNLSHHPSRLWSPEQTAAAVAMAGEVRDVPFPEVSPEAPAERVASVGADLLRQVRALGPAAAMVQGEYTLAFYVVRELEAAGIPCYAATTRRLVRATPLPSGVTRKESLFQFVQFRRYA